MDERSVWNDISNTKLKLLVLYLKSREGDEKRHVSVHLIGKLDGTKCKRLIVFARAIRECKTIHKEFKQNYPFASSENGWMNEQLEIY